MPMLEPPCVANQFPNYPLATLPNTEGLCDTSWCHDTCPSFRKDNLLVWIDWPDRADRENLSDDRYIVVCIDPDGLLDEDGTVLSTDDWDLVRVFMGLDN